MSVDIKDDDQLVPILFGWCASGHHANCRTSHRSFYTEPKNNKLVFLNKVYVCSCKKRGCKCYTKPADRPKVAKKKPRSKS